MMHSSPTNSLLPFGDLNSLMPVAMLRPSNATVNVRGWCCSRNCLNADSSSGDDCRKMLPSLISDLFINSRRNSKNSSSVICGWCSRTSPHCLQNPLLAIFVSLIIRLLPCCWLKCKKKHVKVIGLLRMWLSLNSNSTAFELRRFSPDSKFDECFKHLVVACKFVEKCLFYDRFRMNREPESADKLFF